MFVILEEMIGDVSDFVSGSFDCVVSLKISVCKFEELGIFSKVFVLAK